jgi:SSS family solute:Na+ symporter
MARDLLLAGAILVAVLIAGISLARGRGKGAEDPVERFAAGRTLSPLVLGGSMAASFMSADTPLLIASAVYLDGLPGNWFWWISAPGVLATLFFFARLWRRSGVLTDVGIITLRYGSSSAARGLRLIRAVFEGVVVNTLVLASSGWALLLLLDAMLGERPVIAGSPISLAAAIVALLFAATAAFTVAVGFRGLVRTNTVQFALVLVASAITAGFAVATLPGGLETLRTTTAARSGVAVFDFLPRDGFSVAILLAGLGWFHTAPGGGMLVQRVVAARDERGATATVMTFAALHYLVRPWAWYLIGAAALVHLPRLDSADRAFPAVAALVLPSGLAGLLTAGLLLAFVGSVNTRLNLGASYLVNDMVAPYRPALAARRGRALEAVAVATLTVAALAIALGGMFGSFLALYQYLIVISAGSAFVSIARWYWWRLTIWSEIGALATAIVLGNLLMLVGDTGEPVMFMAMMASNCAGGAAVAIAIAHLGPQTAPATSAAFFARVRPAGPGWRPFGQARDASLWSAASWWLLANVALFATIFAIAELLAGRYLAALPAALALLAAAPIVRRRGRLRSVLGWSDHPA